MATVDVRRQQALSVQSGVARAAVLGVDDGLVTNASLILLCAVTYLVGHLFGVLVS